MAAISKLKRENALLSRLKLKALVSLQVPCWKFKHTFAECERQSQVFADSVAGSVIEAGQIDFSKWRKLDSRNFGINRSMIPPSPWVVLKILHYEGFEAYLVGGCVRDLILNRIPKDFDIITNARLQQIKKQFHHCEIVGRIFPICRVHVKGSIVEVSSFDTVAKHAEKEEEPFVPKMPKGCPQKDLILWKNSMHRDFTINSLFFNPFVNRIYDYANAMQDLRSLKLRTLVPAHLSFGEDCARILRGLRLAARLNLSFTKEIEDAIHELSSSIMSLSKFRIMMELNYMMSYGAAESSLSLLQKYNILEIVLPFHGTYLAQQASKQLGKSSVMLMVFVPNKMGRAVELMFDILVKDVTSLKTRKNVYRIDYVSLGKGHMCETRFLLGKVILDTIVPRVTRGVKVIKEEKHILFEVDGQQKEDASHKNFHENLELMKPKFVSDDDSLLNENCQLQHDIFEKKKLNHEGCSDLVEAGTKKQKIVAAEHSEEMAVKKQDLIDDTAFLSQDLDSGDTVTKKKTKGDHSQLPKDEIRMLLEEVKYQQHCRDATGKEKKNDDKFQKTTINPLNLLMNNVATKVTNSQKSMMPCNKNIVLMK
ncbi:uncharacterized protein LOC129896470 isoform X3 [Solanum dulcamara]|uniref:uncharacterized protein LOC129896470 isoform X3 n=1 Tax=Solanum dulcamara TaxID=45834 RepID=UPI002486ACFC|nr:uncharacterized protein LOC129896470 isoform X3 [Solanum dulcamara]